VAEMRVPAALVAAAVAGGMSWRLTLRRQRIRLCLSPPIARLDGSAGQRGEWLVDGDQSQADPSGCR